MRLAARNERDQRIPGRCKRVEMNLREARRHAPVNLGKLDARAAPAQLRCDQIATAGRADEHDAATAHATELREREHAFAVAAFRHDRVDAGTSERTSRAVADGERDGAATQAQRGTQRARETHGGRALEDHDFGLCQQRKPAACARWRGSRAQRKPGQRQAAAAQLARTRAHRCRRSHGTREDDGCTGERCVRIGARTNCKGHFGRAATHAILHHNGDGCAASGDVAAAVANRE